MYTASLSSAIYTETINVRWGVPVGGEENFLYMGDTASIKMRPSQHSN